MLINWAMKTHKLEAGQFVEFILTRERNETYNEDDMNCGNTCVEVKLMCWHNQSTIYIYIYKKLFLCQTSALINLDFQKSPLSKLISVRLIRYNHCKLIKLTFFVPFTKNGIFKLTKCGLSPKGFCILRSVTRSEWLKRMIAAVTWTGTCIFGDAATFIDQKRCPALGYLTAMGSSRWGNLVAFDRDDLPVGQGIRRQIFENCQIPTPCPAFPSPGWLNMIDRSIIQKKVH